MRFRQGIPDDSVHLAVLADAATRRLTAWLWDQAASPGQSGFEVGREIIRADHTSLLHHSRWRVAERESGSGVEIVGGLLGYELTPPAVSKPSPQIANVMRPLDELKAIAEGTWYVSVASVFSEFRGQGVGQAVLVEADRCAQQDGCEVVTLLVASFNPGARRLYERVGFDEWDRRAFVAFPGSDPAGDWILMKRALQR